MAVVKKNELSGNETHMVFTATSGTDDIVVDSGTGRTRVFCLDLVTTGATAASGSIQFGLDSEDNWIIPIELDAGVHYIRYFRDTMMMGAAAKDVTISLSAGALSGAITFQRTSP